MALPIIADVSRGAWLASRMGERATVGGVAAAGFQAYARILHPAPVDRLGPTPTGRWSIRPTLESARWPWAEVARRRGKTMHPLVQWRRLIDEHDQLEFDDGWRLGQPEEGVLGADLLRALTDHLRATTTPEAVVVGVWHGFGFPGGGGSVAYARVGEVDDEVDEAEQEQWRLEREAQEREDEDALSPGFVDSVEHGPRLELPGREYVLLQTTLHDMASPAWARSAGFGWTPSSRRPMPQLIWPEDHAWVVASEIDWDSTIVAGSRALVDAVLADPRFEAFPVLETDALYWDGDLINPPPETRAD